MGESRTRRAGRPSLPVGKQGRRVRTVHHAGQSELRCQQEGQTTPVGSYPANGYGLYDMAGNVWEWCWDWFDEAWYRKSGATDPNTRGPDSGVDRVYRGGSWAERRREAALRSTATGGTRRLRSATRASVLPEVRFRQRSLTKAESGGRGTRPLANRRSRAER